MCENMNKDINNDVIAYQIIRGEYFNYVMANCINRDFLTCPTDILMNFIDHVDKHSNSEGQVYTKIILNVLHSGRTDQINTFAKCETAFDKLIYIFSIAKSLGEYVKNNEIELINEQSIIRIINELTKMLDEESFQEKLFKDPKYIKFVDKNICTKRKILKFGACVTLVASISFLLYKMLRR